MMRKRTVNRLFCKGPKGLKRPKRPVAPRQSHTTQAPGETQEWLHQPNPRAYACGPYSSAWSLKFWVVWHVLYL